MTLEMASTRQQNISYLASFLSEDELKGSAFEKGTYFRIAKQIQAEERWFLDHPDRIRALKPSAERLTNLFQTTLQNPTKETARRLLSEHNRFTWAFIETFENTYPDHPNVVNVKYRKTIDLFKDVIWAHFSKEEIRENDAEIFIKTPTLAIQTLIQEKTREIPEIFDPEKICDLRESSDPNSIQELAFSVPRNQLTWIFREVLAANRSL